MRSCALFRHRRAPRRSGHAGLHARGAITGSGRRGPRLTASGEYCIMKYQYFIFVYSESRRRVARLRRKGTRSRPALLPVLGLVLAPAMVLAMTIVPASAPVIVCEQEAGQGADTTYRGGGRFFAGGAGRSAACRSSASPGTCE